MTEMESGIVAAIRKMLGSGLLSLSLFGGFIAPAIFAPALLTAAEPPPEIRAAAVRYYPNQFFIDEETGKPSGFAIDIMNEVTRIAGFTIRYVIFEETPLAIEALQEGRVDVIPGLSIDEVRKGSMDFTRPFDSTYIAIFVSATTTDIKGLEDLPNRRVAVIANSTGFHFMRKYSRVKTVVFHSLDEAVISLMTGSTDAFVNNASPVYHITRRAGLADRIKVVGAPLREFQRGIAVGKGKPALLGRLDGAVQELIALPKYQLIHDKWYSKPQEYWNARRAAGAGLILLILAAVVFAVIHYLSLRRLNRELKAALEKLRLHMENSPLAVVEFDREFQITNWSGQAERIFGWSAADAVEKKIDELRLVHEEDLPSTGELRGDILAGRRPRSINTNRNYRKDGSVAICEWYNSSLLDASGNLISVQSLVLDITARCQTEQKLQEAKILLEKTFASLEEVILVTDHQTRNIIACNAALQTVFGYTCEEMIGRNTEILHQDRAAYERIGRQAAAGLDAAGFYRTECLMKHKDGALFPTESMVTEMRNDLGERSGLVVVIRDITARKQAEEERLRLAAAIEQSGEMVLITDREGIIQYINPVLERITGYDRQELLGQTPRLLKSGRQDDAYYQELWETVSDGGIWKGHFVNRKKDGSFFDVDVTISPVRNLAGEITHYVSVKRDTTEQLKIKKMLIQAQKMEAIGTMAAGIAHDFNNILGAISGYTELSLEKIPADSRVKHYLEHIWASTQRAINLVRQILTFSRLGEKELVPIRVTPLIKETLKMLREIIPATIEIRLHAHAQEDKIRGDATQIYQVMMNLCTNAYQAMKDRGGRLDIELAEVRIDAGHDVDGSLPGLPPGSYLHLSVRDTGAGIDPLIQDRIFDPFFTTKKVGEGTGLGLSVVHGIITDYGGEIVLESTVGVGSAFHIYLPLMAEDMEMEVAETETAASDGRGTVLVVDDEETLAYMIREMLEDRGYEVTVKTNAVEALETFRGDPDRFDLIVADLTMPVMTGIELSENLMNLRDNIPVILCTGVMDDYIKEKANALGIKATLLKPVNMKQLMGLMRRLLPPVN